MDCNIVCDLSPIDISHNTFHQKMYAKHNFDSLSARLNNPCRHSIVILSKAAEIAGMCECTFH